MARSTSRAPRAPHATYPQALLLPGFALACLLGACAAEAPAIHPTGLADTPHPFGPRLADAMLSAGANDAALHVTDAMLERDSRDPAALLRRGRALLALGRAADAAPAFAAAAAVDPSSTEALLGLARARTEAGEPEQAESAWRAALDRAQSDPALRARTQTGLAIALDLQSRHDEAQALYRAVLAAQPDNAAARADLGLSLALGGHASDALPLLRQASTQGPPGSAQSLRVRHNLAVGLALAGDDAGARGLLAQDLDPQQTAAALAGLYQIASAQ